MDTDKETILDSAVDAGEAARRTGTAQPAGDGGREPSELEQRMAAIRAAATADKGGDPSAGASTLSPAPSDPVPVRPPTGFAFERELGRGGMGVVYLARQHGLNRPVALKMMLTAAPKAVIRFLAEAEAVAAVEHENVVQVYQFGEDGGRPFLALEYCSGGDLTAHTQKRTLTDRQVAELMAGVAAGVGAAHAAGVIHRDLKPSNVLLAGGGPLPFGTPKVTDFGLAKLGLGTDLTPAEAVMGTPAYMSPEQAGGRAKFVGPEADVWALGVMLYELLAGARPFPGPSHLEFIAQTLAGEYPPLEAICPGVPRDLARIVAKCLRREPRERYASGGELAADLRNWLAGKPITARPPRVTETVCRWVGRHKAVTALLAVLLVLAVALPPLLIWNQSRLELARRDGDAARDAQKAAEELAAQREVFRLLGDIRRRAIERPVGWTDANRADARRALALSADPTVRDALRAELAAADLAFDLRPCGPGGSGKPPFQVLPVAASPDGAVVAVGEYGAWAAFGYTSLHIALIDSATQQVRRTLRFPAERAYDKRGDWCKDGVCALAFSPDGKRLFATSRASRIYRFDLDDERDTAAAAWKGLTHELETVAVGGDGRVIHAADNKQVGSWDTDTKKKLGVADVGGVRGLIRDPHRPELLATTDGGFLFSLNPSTLAAAGLGTPHRQDRAWHAGGFLAGGRAFVGATGHRLTLGDPRAADPHRDALIDPKLRASAHATGVTRLACHPTLPVTASVSDHGNDRAVKVWCAASGQLVANLTLPAGTDIHLAWAGPDCRTLVASTGTELLRWELVVPTCQRTTPVVPASVADAAVAPGGRTVTLDEPDGGGTIRVDAPDGRAAVAHVLERRDNPDHAGDTGVDWCPATGRLAANIGHTGCQILRTDRTPFERVALLPHAREVRFSSDGGTLWHLSGGQKLKKDGHAVTARDAATLAVRGEWTNHWADRLTGLAGIDRLAAGRDRAVAGGNAGDVFVFDGTARLLGTAPAGRRDDILSLAVAADDSVAVAGTQSGAIRVLDPNGPHPAHATLDHRHEGGTTAVAASGDGRLLATAGKDHAVRLWRRVEGLRYEPILTVPGLPNEGARLQFGADGRTLMVLLRDEHAVRVWDLDRLQRQLGEFGLGW